MGKNKILLAYLLLPLLVVGCATMEQKANKDFYNGLYDEALVKYKKVVDEKYKKKDKSYVIHVLNYGMLNYYAGYFDQSKNLFWNAYQVDEGDISGAAKTMQFLKAGDARVYKLSKREKSIEHFYLGQNFLLLNKPDEAIIEFKKIDLYNEDKAKYPLADYYSGISYEIAGKTDDALIEYKSILTPTKKDTILYAPIYLDIARIYNQQENTTEVGNNISLYKRYIVSDSLTSVLQNDFLPLGNKQLVVQIDHDGLRPLIQAKIYVDDVYMGNSRVFDTFDPNTSVGEFMRGFAKEMASELTRQAIGAIPIVGLFSGLALGDGRDLRSWYYAPAGFSIFASSVPQNAKNIKIVFYEKKGKKFLKKSEQNYIVGQKQCVASNNYIYLTVRYQNKPYDKLKG